MAYRLPPLNSLRAFEAAARLGSFQAAANELSVTPSALSYQIRQLEEHLRIPLFHRMNRAVALTDAGERLYPGTHEGFERLQGAVASLDRLKATDTLVVSSGPAFAAKWLAPRMYRFVDAHPDIEMRIAASLRLVDFHVDQVDVGIRFGSGDYPGLHVEPLFEEVILPLASPDYVARHGLSEGPQALSRATLLHDTSSNFVRGSGNWRGWMAAAGVDGVDAARGPQFSHADHGLDAAVDGAGIVLGRLSIAWRDIESGRLVAPFETYLSTRAGFHFVTLAASLEQPNIAVFRSWLLEEANAQAEAMAAFLSERSRMKV